MNQPTPAATAQPTQQRAQPLLDSGEGRDEVPRLQLAVCFVAIGIVWCIGALAYRDSTLIADSARDLVAAARIIAEGELPAAGPSLYGTWVASPLWFWLVAALVWCLPSLSAVSVALGALAISKLALAWCVGRRLAGSWFAAVFALWMCWPGWSFIEQVVVTHTNLVQATALLFVLAALRAREAPTMTRIVLMFGAFVVALAMHPTNLLYAPLLALPMLAIPQLALPTVANAGKSADRGVAWLIGALVVALGMLPTILGDAGDASASYLSRLPEPGWLERWPRIFLAVLVDAQGSMLQQIALHWPWVARALQASYWIMLAVALPGLLLVPRRQRVAVALALATLVAGSAALALVRTTAPTWMVLALQPLAYGILACGFAAAVARMPARMRPWILMTLLLASTAAGLGYAALRHQRAAAGFEWHATARVTDVTAPARLGAINGPHLPPRAVDAVEKLACGSQHPLALFGELAVFAEASQGATLRMSGCPRARWPWLGPAAGARNVAGLPAGIAAQIGMGGDPWANLVRVDVARVIAPAQGARIVYNERYPPYDGNDLRAHPLNIDTALDADEILVVTSVLNGFVAPTTTLFVGGLALVEIADTGTSRYFSCPNARACRVQGTVVAGARPWLQVFVLARLR